MVIKMRANGMAIDAIASVMTIDVQTLRNRFKDELELGFNLISARMGAALIDAGLEGNISAIKFWLANRCPEWRLAREDQNAEAPERDDDVVHFFLPPNGRDQPEELPDPPTIDGTAA